MPRLNPVVCRNSQDETNYLESGGGPSDVAYVKLTGRRSGEPFNGRTSGTGLRRSKSIMFQARCTVRTVTSDYWMLALLALARRGADIVRPARVTPRVLASADSLLIWYNGEHTDHPRRQ